MSVQALSAEANVFYEKAGVDTFAPCPLTAHDCLDHDVLDHDCLQMTL
jgi:hypothetical protein